MWGGNICLIEEENITSGYDAHDDLMTPRYVQLINNEAMAAGVIKQRQ